jgi:hypothetical protein
MTEIASSMYTKGTSVVPEATAKHKLHSFLHSKQIPNLILHGPSGSGKRTLLSEFLYEVYRRPTCIEGAHDTESTDTILKSNVMVVNCSHGNKGIKFIRDEFKFFAKTNIQTNYGVPFKSIVLLNADCLTIDAQTALRRCIELFSHSTRFFIIVKDKHRLLNPILSRFCEIYVPEPETCSFHQQRLARQFPALYQSDTCTWPCTWPVSVSDTLCASDLMIAATQWYEQGKPAIRLIRMLSNDPLCSPRSMIDPEHVNLVILCFYKIKDDIRHEKTLIFHVLFAVHLCSKTDIKNMLMM